MYVLVRTRNSSNIHCNVGLFSFININKQLDCYFENILTHVNIPNFSSLRYFLHKMYNFVQGTKYVVTLLNYD